MESSVPLPLMLGHLLATPQGLSCQLEELQTPVPFRKSSLIPGLPEEEWEMRAALESSVC